MSNYTKIQNWSSLSGAIITGAPFDTEFASVAAASATKTNKIIPASVDNLAGLSVSGDLTDSGIAPSGVVDAVAFHYTSGDIKATAVDSEPTGWLYADGGSHSTSVYDDLFSAIGYTYGGSGASFNVPDLRGTVVAGMDNLGGASANNVTSANADSLGGSFGSDTHTLTVPESPAHTHGHSLSNDGTHIHDINARSSSGGSDKVSSSNSGSTSSTVDTNSAGDHTHTLVISNEGGGNSHNNVQPTLFVNYLIKT